MLIDMVTRDKHQFCAKEVGLSCKWLIKSKHTSHGLEEKTKISSKQYYTKNEIYIAIYMCFLFFGKFGVCVWIILEIPKLIEKGKSYKKRCLSWWDI